MDIVKEDINIREVQAFKVSVNRTGILALFCGPYSFLLLNLDDPKVKRKSKISKNWENSLCQWNKCVNDRFAVALHNVCRLYDVEMMKIESLKGHNRSISSIDWHPTNKDQLATVSLDNSKSLCIWDLRKSTNPSHWIDTSGFHLIRWNKVVPNYLATSFNNEIRLWDVRNLTCPINSLTAHFSKVCDFDWHPREESVFVSSGQDRRFKVWNFSEDICRPRVDFDDDVCISRSRFNSYGDFLLTLSSSSAATDYQLRLWDFSYFSEPQTIDGCSSTFNTITDFEWRKNYSEFGQFLTLHKNFDVKIWQIESSLIQQMQKRKISTLSTLRPRNSSDNFNNFMATTGSPCSTMIVADGIKISTGLSQAETGNFVGKNEFAPTSVTPKLSETDYVHRENTLFRQGSTDIEDFIQKEFDHLNNGSQVIFEKRCSERSVTVRFTVNNIRCVVEFLFQSTSSKDKIDLEISVIPAKSENIRTQNLEDIERILKTTAEDCQSRNGLIIEKCVNVTLDYLNKLSNRMTTRTLKTFKDPNTDARVPAPRICGATFSPSGLLVCFMLPWSKDFMSNPRSLVDAGTSSQSQTKRYYAPSPILGKTIIQRGSRNILKKYNQYEPKSESEYNPVKLKSGLNLQPTGRPSFNVVIYNMARLSLFDANLARKYSVDVDNIEKLCGNNEIAVSESRRKDLVEFWKYCRILVDACRPNNNLLNSIIKPWSNQMIGRFLCDKWLQHFIKIRDIQSAAMFIIVMLSIDDRLNDQTEGRFPNSISLTSLGKSPMSQESGMDVNYGDNTSFIQNALQTSVSVSTVTCGPTFFKQIYDDKSAAVLIVSATSFENQSGRTYSSWEDIDCHQQTSIVRKSESQTEMLFKHKEACRLIDKLRLPHYCSILLHYSHMLSAHNLVTISRKIMKKAIPFMPSYCHLQDNFTVAFTNVPSICSICRLSIRGLVIICSQCNHGGHVQHLESWFSRSKSQGLCPTGCGCRCSPTIAESQENISVIPVS